MTDVKIQTDENIISLVKSLPSTKRRDIARLLDANRNRKIVDETTHLKFIKECMELLDDTTLQNSDKKLLVIAFYNDVSQSDDNEFRQGFDAGEAVEFIFDLSKMRFGVKLRKKGFLESCLPCCSSVSVVYSGETKSLSLNAEPLQNIAKKSQLSEALA